MLFDSGFCKPTLYQVVTAKCSEINVHVLPDNDSDAAVEPLEFAVPEQFVSSFGPDGQLTTTASKHSGA
jgi:hypothetical protein